MLIRRREIQFNLFVFIFQHKKTAVNAAKEIKRVSVFPDHSVIDFWGITYYSDGVIRGADLNDLFRYSE